MQRMVVIGWGLSFGPVLDWLVGSNRIARLRNLSVGGVHGHISSGWLQADIDSVNRLSWIAMTDVTEGGDTGCEPLLANTHLGHRHSPAGGLGCLPLRVRSHSEPCFRRFRLRSREEVLKSDRKSTRLNSSHLGISYAV